MNFAILGAGGIGYHLAEDLARLICYPPAVVKDRFKDPVLWIIDGDEVEDHNLGRQHGAASVGRNKAEVLADFIRGVFPQLQVRTVPLYLSDKLLSEHREWLKEGITIFGCVDNNTTRCFVEDRLDRFDDFTWVDGGNDEDSGQAMAWRRTEGVDRCPAITRRNPEMRQESTGDTFPDQVDCSQEWVTQPQLALANRAVSTAMLQLWFSHMLTKPNDMMTYNAIPVSIDGRSEPQVQRDLQLI